MSNYLDRIDKDEGDVAKSRRTAALFPGRSFRGRDAVGFGLAREGHGLSLENDDFREQTSSPALNSLGREPFKPPLQTVNVSRSSL